MIQGGEEIGAAQVSEAIDTVLARQSRQQPSMLQQLIEWVFDRLGMDFTSTTWQALYWILLVALVVLFVVFLRRYAVAVQIGRSRRAVDGEVTGPTVAERVALLRREASEARRTGDLRLALRKQFFALVLGLGNRGDLEFRDAWTNRELLERGRPSPETNAILSPLVSELEAKEFGHEPVVAFDLDRLESLLLRYLGPAQSEGSKRRSA